ncbi:hypothetical protein D3C76_1207280 [compost metagenome]
MLHQIGTDAAAEHHIEDTGRYPLFLHCTFNSLCGQFRRDHMATMCLEHHGATGGQRGGGITTGGRERQREITGTKHRNRTDGHAILA